jgi:hypothetical protein
MEENNVMNNEEVIETTTEEIVKASSSNGLKTATTIGLAMIAGALVYRFVVAPGMTKVKIWKANRKQSNEVVSDYDGEYVDDPDYDEDSES